jgi:D-alanyl-D-alanine carboxypeptidase/D-alanyl-D-alanine-endopeptidase (penicillin-binding protein 4)
MNIIRSLSLRGLLQVFLLVAFAGLAVGQAMKVSPTPTPALLPLKNAKTGQTLDDLRAKIRDRMLSPEVSRGRVGIKITSLKSGKVIFENDAEKYFIPASNMKNFTVAAALEKLGPDFRFVTSVYADAKPDGAGTIKGDLRIFGRGDISISTAFNNGDYYKGIDNLVDKIAAAGVRRVEGDLVGDESYFHGNPIPPTWEADDLQWYDGAEISPLSVNNNAVDLTVKGGSPGAPCVVSLLPTNTFYKITNTCTTTSARTSRALVVKKSLEQNSVSISGSMPAADSWTGYITFTHPADLFIALLKQRLSKKSIVVTGGVRTSCGPDGQRPPQRSLEPLAQMDTGELARLESPPLSVIVAKTMKPSQNMFTETILWTLGEVAAPMRDYVDLSGVIQPAPRRPDSPALGLQKVKEVMEDAHIPPDAVLQYDGSGMSRHDQVTPSAVVQLYTYMAKQSKNTQVWRDSLTVGGVDGTLSRRFTGTAAAGNIRGKTGTLDQVSALSGYVTTAAGEELVVSIIVNGVADTHVRTSLIDDIVVQLANFNGKID